MFKLLWILQIFQYPQNYNPAEKEKHILALQIHVFQLNETYIKQIKCQLVCQLT